MEKNEVEANPIINQKTSLNSYDLIFPKINKNFEILHCLFTLFYNNKMNMSIEVKGIVKNFFVIFFKLLKFKKNLIKIMLIFI